MLIQLIRDSRNGFCLLKYTWSCSYPKILYLGWNCQRLELEVCATLTLSTQIGWNIRKFCQVLVKPPENCRIFFYNFAKVAKFRQIWSTVNYFYSHFPLPKICRRSKSGESWRPHCGWRTRAGLEHTVEGLRGIRRSTRRCGRTERISRAAKASTWRPTPERWKRFYKLCSGIRTQDP